MGYRIALVSDFFLPVTGGVEVHVYQLAVHLLKRGHKVVVVTHSHPPDRVGVRYLLAEGGVPVPTFIKIYHLPLTTIASSASLPNFLLCLPYFRSIFLRERIEIVHGHGTLSSMAHEALFHGPFFGVRTIFTDHSLFGFDDAVGILTNKLLAAALMNADGIICVSYTGKENTCLRAQLNPHVVSVIPNAIIPGQFLPDTSKIDKNVVTIVVISRLVFRKGIDLLVASAPHICRKYPNVRFLIAGDGPKRLELLQMRDKYDLHDQVELLGATRPGDVRSVLNRGQIYLTTSLTEAFGMSIIEAACAGLHVVSTKVGGVHEILPHDMIEFALPDVADVVRALSHAIDTVSEAHDADMAHARVKVMYDWTDVAARVEDVYKQAMASEPRSTFERLARLLDLGPIFGPILCIITAVQWLFLSVLDVLYPRDTIDAVVDAPSPTLAETMSHPDLASRFDASTRNSS